MKISAGVLRWTAFTVLGSVVGCGVQTGQDGDEPVTAGAVAEQSFALAEENVTLPAVSDTALRALSPNQNFGTAAVLDVNRPLVRFDQAAIRAALGPTDYLVGARLELRLTRNALRAGAPARAVSAFRLNKAWTENGATWNCAVDADPSNRRADCSGESAWSMGVAPPNPWATPASASATIAALQTGVVGFDVTADVRAYLSGAAANQGWVLMSGPLGAIADFADFASRETSTPPRLVLSVRRCSASLCDDGNACTADSCDAVGQCVSADLPDGSACSDGNACTQVDSCQSGSCAGASPVVCSANDQCHAAGSCDPSSGVCSNPALADGSACDDGDACTAGDQCVAGACSAGAMDLCAPPPQVVINEAESSQGVPGDWTELYNAGTTAADLSGWVFKDGDDAHAYTLPSGSVIAAGGYLVLEEGAFGFGLGTNESVRIYDPNGVLIDSQSWGPHAATTYGRCPNGSGAFTTMTSVTKGAANDCSVPLPKVVINEAESSGGVPGDWVELYNAGTTVADLSGFVFKDGDDTHNYALPSGSTIAPGGYLLLEEAAFGFGLGQPESVRLFAPDGLTVVDSQSWTTHATTSYGRCPNGSGAFTTTSSVTKGAANDCGFVIPPVVINEAESSGGVPGDWVELYNAGPSPVNLSGYVFKDADDTHAYAIPAGSSIAAGGYLVLEEAAFGFGLGQPESVRLFAPDGLTVIDSQSWTTHAATTYGRCPSGTGAFTDQVSVTKGAENDCGQVRFRAWPGGDAVATVDLTSTFTSNLSGLTYQPATASEPAVLWASLNGPGTIFKLIWDGSAWVPSTSDGWGAGRALRYPEGTGNPDAEGLTKAGWDSSAIYVATERNNDANSVSRLSVLRFDASGSGAILTATHEWNLTADLPVVGANLGLEAITYIPDDYLVDNGFIDESTGALYDPLQYADHGGGVFFLGVETTGKIYAYVLDHANGGFQQLAEIDSGHVGVMGLEFDRDVGGLWAHCDNTCNNRSTVLAVEADPSLSAFGHFVVQAAFERPAGIPATMNNEGLAIAPESECVAGVKPIFWSDDGDTGGNSLRTGTVSCGPLF